jgi:hypothetical protein
MHPDSFALAFVEDNDLPAPDAADQVLVRWLWRRLGRSPSWLEVIAFRAGLREKERRSVRRAWWRRLWKPNPPTQEDLVADFLRSPEGQILFQLSGGMIGLLARLALADPWEGFDARHPTTPRPTRRETLRERVALGCPVPMREQAKAVLAYANWKLTGRPEADDGGVPEAAEFLGAAHAAAINVMTGAAVMGVCARLRGAGGGDVKRRMVLRELDRVGGEALQRWPGIGLRLPDAPLGIWPLPADDDGPAWEPAPEPSGRRCL